MLINFSVTVDSTFILGEIGATLWVKGWWLWQETTHASLVKEGALCIYLRLIKDQCDYKIQCRMRCGKKTLLMKTNQIQTREILMDPVIDSEFSFKFMRSYLKVLDCNWQDWTCIPFTKTILTEVKNSLNVYKYKHRI